jgi:hypothetical protein
MNTPLITAGACAGSLLILAAAVSVQSMPSYEYGRLVFTVGGSGTTVWLNTPTSALSAVVSKDSENKLDDIASAIQATAPDMSFPGGVPIDDMMLVNWMGLAKWELVAVTQNQVDIGVTTSYYYKRKK